MSPSQLQMIVRTPREIVVERFLRALRVPTETGQVGLRARGEPLVLAVEPGLLLMRMEDDYEYVGTAGGLLRCDGVTAKMLTPLAVAGKDERQVMQALEAALAKPNIELEARSTFDQLQHNILQELRQAALHSVGTDDKGPFGRVR